MKKAVLGLSDGVDSAVAAHLLKTRGFDVRAVYLDIAGEKERRDAEESARRLGIPFTAYPAREKLARLVFAPFYRAYLEGRTVNPCVLCNPLVKLALLEKAAQAEKADYIATGHYIVSDGKHLYRGHPDNDQSYMLCRASAEQIRRLLLPLGGMSKTETRDIARRLGLPAANKPDSRDLCMLPKGTPYWQAMEQMMSCPGPGEILFRDRVIGRHEGIHRYTVGQRLPAEEDGRYLYVGRIDPEKNILVAALWEELFRKTVLLEDPRFFEEPPVSPFRGEIRIHHTRHETPGCTVTLRDGLACVTADSPLRAPCPGQAAALYIGTRLIGSGIVSRTE